MHATHSGARPGGAERGLKFVHQCIHTYIQVCAASQQPHNRYVFIYPIYTYTICMRIRLSVAGRQAPSYMSLYPQYVIFMDFI